MSRKLSEDFYRQMRPFAAAVFESRCSEVADQNASDNAIADPKRDNSLQ
jgi:hypothetical protein